jgi:proton glutamate symport protein
MSATWRTRFRLSLGSATFIACLLGLLGGSEFARLPDHGYGFVWYGADWLPRIFLSIGNWLAPPLIFASIVTGANGLEPMRGVGRLATKTALWIAGSSAVAALVGLLVARVLRPMTAGMAAAPGEQVEWPYSSGPEIWLVCVLVAVAMAVYRNQIEETRSRLLLRFATAVDETLTLVLEWSRRLIPPAVGLMAFSTAARASLGQHDGLSRLPGLAGALAVGWSIYGLCLLPLALLAGARLNPWRYARVMGAPIMTALAGASPTQVFPLTLYQVRTRAGVSNRVCSLVLAGCTALLRDGQALGWATALAWVITPAPLLGTGGEIFLAAWLLGCTNAAGPAAPWLLCALIPAAAADRELLLGLGLLIELAGNGVSVFSQTCAAAIIARSEGETNFLPNPPRSALITPLPLETPIL